MYYNGLITTGKEALDGRAAGLERSYLVNKTKFQQLLSGSRPTFDKAINTRIDGYLIKIIRRLSPLKARC